MVRFVMVRRKIIKIKFEGKRPTLSSMKEMRTFMAGIRKHGNMFSSNRHFVYEGDILRSAGRNRSVELKHMRMGRTLFSICGTK